MPEEIVSVGECLFCNKSFTKAAITKHLGTHLGEKVKDGKPGKSFQVRIETNPKWGASPYFLSLWVDGNATTGNIDVFLRHIWLECCGHMSSFADPKKRRKGGGWNFFDTENLFGKGKTKEYEKLMEEQNGEIPMSKKAKDVLRKGLKLNYEYDFGSTTDLQVTVTDEYPVPAGEKVVLLSRNEPLELLCEMCGTEPATLICSVCMDHEENMFCKKCAKKHGKTCSDFDDYAAMPVVNSPRMGVCAYDGGSIDKKRDGVFIKK